MTPSHPISSHLPFLPFFPRLSFISSLVLIRPDFRKTAAELITKVKIDPYAVALEQERREHQKVLDYVKDLF